MVSWTSSDQSCSTCTEKSSPLDIIFITIVIVITVGIIVIMKEYYYSAV